MTHSEANKLAALNQAMRSCGRCAEMTRDERATHYREVLDEVLLHGRTVPCEFLRVDAPISREESIRRLAARARALNPTAKEAQVDRARTAAKEDNR